MTRLTLAIENALAALRIEDLLAAAGIGVAAGCIGWLVGGAL